MSETLAALNRFGLGARPEEGAAIRDPRGWLRAQLSHPPLLAPPEGASPGDLSAALGGLRAAAADPAARREARMRLQRITSAESRAALGERVRSDAPFAERLVAFWSNHLCVSGAGRAAVAPLAGSYEREVIRPHLLGRFDEMLLASARHPAMLLYLDNYLSIGPASPGARLARRQTADRGLNENYARELLELHTLGVDGGYAQVDVVELARVLTGWSVVGAGLPRLPARATGEQAAGPIRFAFRPALHEPGTKRLLGVALREDGEREGDKAIRALAAHPSTARFVARKLAGHFISDDPPAAAVQSLERTFSRTQGDLRAVAETLIDLPDAWGEEARKFRTPQDWLVALLRAAGAEDAPEATIALLRQLRHPLWFPPSPAGFGDATREWADPDSLLNRAELARTLARRLVASAPDPARLADVMDIPAGDPLRTLLADRSIAAPERFALAVAGPAFQWR